MNMLTFLDVPKQIYLYQEDDLVKQLSSVGKSQYANSHNQPYGNRRHQKVTTSLTFN